MTYTSTYNSALILEWVILLECDYHTVTLITTGRKKLLKKFNIKANRKISMSSLDRYIRILKDLRLLNRWKQPTIYTPFGRLYRTAKSGITEKGRKALEWIGLPAEAVWEEIKARLSAPKEEAPSKEEKGARDGSTDELETDIDTVNKTIYEG